MICILQNKSGEDAAAAGANTGANAPQDSQELTVFVQSLLEQMVWIINLYRVYECGLPIFVYIFVHVAI